MKLYYTKGACSLAVRIVLNEIGVKFESEAVNLKTKQTETDKNFLEINPKGAVPTLQLDNHDIITENAVIQQYLADTFKTVNILPAEGDLKRYRVLEWLNFIGTDLHKTCAVFFNSEMPEAARKIYHTLLEKRLAYTNQQLVNKTFLVGEHFTIADSYLFVVLSWMSHLNVDLAHFPELTKYFNALKQRPSVQKSLKEEGIA